MIINDSINLNEEENWKTMHGAHILVDDDGEIIGGPDPKKRDNSIIYDDNGKKKINQKNYKNLMNKVKKSKKISNDLKKDVEDTNDELEKDIQIIPSLDDINTNSVKSEDDIPSDADVSDVPELSNDSNLDDAKDKLKKSDTFKDRIKDTDGGFEISTKCNSNGEKLHLLKGLVKLTKGVMDATGTSAFITNFKKGLKGQFKLKDYVIEQGQDAIRFIKNTFDWEDIK